MKLSIIIVNYNVKFLLEYCLLSVEKAIKKIEAEILVIDNNSNDGSKEFFQDRFPHVNFIWNESNLGFAKANNKCLARAKGEFILFLNPDTLIPEDGLESCISFFENNLLCGALGVRMIDGTGKFLPESKRGFPSVRASFGKLTGLHKLPALTKLFGGYYSENPGEREIGTIDVISGAFFMARKQLLQKNGGFDERYFMYGEDIDLSYSLQHSGFRNYYFPDVTIIHFKGESKQSDRVHIQRFYGAMREFSDKFYRKNIFKNVVLKTAISFSELIAGCRAALTLFPKKIEKPATENLFVIASADRFKEVSKMFNNSIPPVHVAGRVSPGDEEQLQATKQLKEAEEILQKNKKAMFLFCESPMSFKQLIESIEKLSRAKGFFYHAAKSRSIIAAGNKFDKSRVITEPLNPP